MSNTSDWLTRHQLAQDLRRLGVVAGQTLMVHSSVRAVGPVLGGPNSIIEALLEALTPNGTLMMYIGWNESPTDIFDWSPDLQALFRAECPPYDPRTSRAVRDHGILVETFRTWPGVLRSAHPDCSIGATGAQAAYLLADHPFYYGYGAGSPLHKLCQLGGSVLMLGAPLDTLTLLHYAEDQAQLPNKRIKHYACPILREGARVWVDLEEFDTSENVIDAPYSFEQIAQEYLASGKGAAGMVGRAHSYLLDAQDVAQYGITWLEEHFAAGQVAETAPR